MPSAQKISPNAALRNLPSVDELLRSDLGREIAVKAGEDHLAELVRDAVDNLRTEIRSGCEFSKAELAELAEQGLSKAWQRENLTGIRRVINATGVVIHTNLGRAPLSAAARENIADEASEYCTLEYDIESGKRGKRGLRAENLLAELTGAQSVLIVNNCAAAAFFVLTVFASGGEVVISRGELVEIGGDFRVPDVLTASGAVLREIGTTNRTKLTDYENAINEKTRLILRVHPSNYRIVGFTAMPALGEMAELAHRHQIILYEDIGSGALIDLTKLGLGDEPVVSMSLAAGADIVTFSGDKLLGGPQAGIIAGKSAFIDRLRKHPLYRALRVDKLTYVALESTLDAYRRDAALTEIPVLKMLSLTKKEIALRAERIVANVASCLNLRIELIDGESAIGGGAAPAVKLETVLIAITHSNISAAKLEKAFRDWSRPIITRIVDDQVVIDLRTVSESDENELATVLMEIGS